MFNAITELVLQQKKENAARQNAEQNKQTVKLDKKGGKGGKGGKCCK